MMQIQRGQVRYKDRSDIVCTYGVNDNGKQYFFLDEDKIGNNYIASTALVEAIDPLVVASNIGVISSEGNIVIPFDNKMIKSIFDGVLLAQKAIPSSESVQEAIKLRRDPLAATRLVTTPATIKDRINAKMGEGGRFVFNDQFSEATIYDLDGNNLINGEYYSFIGLNKGVLYMSKNTIDSDVVIHRLVEEEPEEQEQQEELPKKELIVNPKIEERPRTEFFDTEEKEEEKELKEEPYEDKRELEVQVEDEKFSKTNFDKINDVEEFKDKDLDYKKEGTFFGDFNLDDGNNNIRNDNILEDTAEMLSKLIKKNKELKEELEINEKKMNEYVSFKRQAFNENQKLLHDNHFMKKRIQALENELTTTSSKLEQLNQELAGKNELVKLLEDAKDLLDE